MHPKGSRKCRHCGEFFVADVRNRRRQWHCAKEPCRKARKAETQRRWLSRPENADYFRGPENVARVKAWRAANPKRRVRLAKKLVLQDILNVQPSKKRHVTDQDDSSVLQDCFIAKDPALVGLIAHLAGTPLQDNIAEIIRRLDDRGRALTRSEPEPSSERKLTTFLHRSRATQTSR